MKRVASLNLIASDCGVFSSISSHAARARDPRFVGPDSSERALFRDWRGALLREEVANRRDALRRRQHGRTEAAKLVRVAEAKLLVLCTHRVDARDIATPLADVIVMLRKVLQHRP